MIILLLSLVLSASLLHPPLCQRILQSLYEIISFISTLKVVKPTTSQEREELDGEDLPNPPSPLSRQETGLTLRPQPRTSETEDDGESEETIPRHEAVPSHDTEDASATETEDVVTRPDLGKRAKQPARVTGEIQTVVVPSNPSVINFRLNQIGIDLRKQFPDAPLFGRYNDALELPLFIQHLRQKLLWDKEMYPTKQDQIAYALGRLDDEERAYFTEYINEDGSVRLDSLDDFIKILSEKHSKSEKAIDTLKSTISLLQSRLKSKIKEPELKRQGILSDFHVDIWPAFKQLVEDKPPAAIQALSGKPKLYWERSMDDTKPFSVSTEARGPLEVWEEKWKSGREIPERVRINSPGLLRALKDISEGEWAMSEVPDDDYEGLENQSVVFLRPYKFFWHYRENINKKREELEGKVRRLEESRTAAEKARMDAAESEPTSHEKELQEEFHQTRQLLDDVKCLTRFIENAVTPVALKYRDKENIPQKITFSDLWYLFSPGEIAVSRGSTEDDAPVSGREGDRTASQNTSSEPTAWRIFDMTDGRPRLSPGYSDDEYMQTGKIFNSFEIQCYKIDFDGYKMGPTINYFNIAHFEGEREINSLRLVPLRCTKDLEKLQQRFEKIGRKFLSVTKRPYCHQKYVGKKYTHCSNGAECLPAVEGLGSTPKHIQGSVIVDFATAGKEDPKWLSFQGLHDPLVADSTEFTETWSFKVWRVKKKEEHESSKATGEGKADRQAYRCIHREEHIYNDSHIDRSIRLKLVSEDPFLSEFQRGSDDERITVEDFEKKFFKDNKLILAEKVCAYILDRMCFALLAVEGLDEPIKMSRGWDDLQLQSTHQTVIKALVKKHMTKHDQGAAQKSRPTHDLVAGKGEGLIILLHGAPGLGKTSTVECLRDELRAPLLSLSCGNLGNDAQEIERNLDMLFYRAQLWNCLTLLDEADVVLVERGKDQFKENEVCSVFLRKLEYYQGVLFLTTNRVGHIDEAIKSRIHLAVHYPNLTEDVMEELLHNTLLRLKSSDEYKSRLDVNMRDIERNCMQFIRKKLNPKSVNGRIIRNVSQVALALAEEEAPEISSLRPLPLRWRHFEQALQFHAYFEDYLEDIRGSDSQRATELTLRSDEWSIVKKEKKEK